MKWFLLCVVCVWAAPSWVLQGQNDKFKYPEYLTSSGSSEATMAKAEELAIAGVAKQFKANIYSRLKDIQTDYNQGESSEEQTISSTKVVSQLSLLGIKIVDRYTEEGLNHALAAFNIKEAFAKLALELNSEEGLRDSLGKILLQGPQRNDREFRRASAALMESLQRSQDLWKQQSLIRPVEAGLSPKIASGLVQNMRSIWERYSWQGDTLTFQGRPISRIIMVLRNQKWSQERSDENGHLSIAVDSAFVPGFSWSSFKLIYRPTKDKVISKEAIPTPFLDGKGIPKEWKNNIPSHFASQFASECKTQILGSKTFYRCQITALDGKWRGKRVKSTSSAAKIALEKAWTAWQLRSK